MTYRYRAFLDHDPGLDGLLRVEPGRITERWVADKVLGNVPERWSNDETLRGVVRRVIGKRATQDHAGRANMDPHAGQWEVITEDVAPLRADLGAVLTMLTGTMLGTPDAVSDLLRHLAGRTVVTDEQVAAVVKGYVGFVADHVPPRVLDLVRHLGNRAYDTADAYMAFVEGAAIAGGLTRGVMIPAPTFDVTIPPERITQAETRTQPLRQDAVERIIRNRAN